MITCIIVAVNYSDILNLTLERNRSLFNNFVVVTTREDVATQEVCNKYGVEVLKYNCCHCHYDRVIVSDPSKLFNLSKMINQGLMHCYEKYPDSWYLYLNSDIVLSPSIKALDTSSLDPELIHGCRRYVCPTMEEFVEYMSTEDGPKLLNMEKRFGMVNNENVGEMPIAIGFFQLFKKVVFYDQQILNPENNFDATHTDWLFINKFKGKHELEGYRVLHLGKTGAYWYGRKPKEWSIEV